MEKLKQLQEILKTIIMLLLFIGLVFVGYERYDLKQKEEILIRAFTDDCANNVSTNLVMIDVSVLSDNARLPESIRTKAIYECSKKIYESKK